MLPIAKHPSYWFISRHNLTIWRISHSRLVPWIVSLVDQQIATFDFVWDTRAFEYLMPMYGISKSTLIPGHIPTEQFHTTTRCSKIHKCFSTDGPRCLTFSKLVCLLCDIFYLSTPIADLCLPSCPWFEAVVNL